jgi:hypothetical protein
MEKRYFTSAQQQQLINSIDAADDYYYSLLEWDDIVG